MKYKNIYLIFSLLFVPIYIFHAPIISYIHNFDKITYSLTMPENNLETDSADITNFKDLNISNDIPLRKVISESWIISFPEINSEKLVSNFKNDLKKIGITSVIKLNSSAQTKVVSIGPFVDKDIAESIALKINKSLGYSGGVKRLNN
ncbi:MAG: SPOR domain-containing protein [Gammaproteobacteria bacterium]|jgi:hypothetical protein|nr:SPOR domain-containing protein [Gammaproteobacteria bacterium]MBT4461872.1 SPOR domain-containing protein [Gammaproteobacteria bacterium]MBT4654261.1 SPOR domain-containing protein [Gammaproteobacteria bacterium]MBT5116287.1 SPOR domain-containing protein [Gammaproteobacteria bacterium]MBT5761166.1 SPOR domain-containing protein [Gammaproteobacteria bacterium]